MSRHTPSFHSVEALESRIAPAAIPIIDGVFKPGQVGSRIALHAGEGLTTGGTNSGSYLLYVEQGDCLVFTTDLNNNGQLDYNEITGIAAGDGLRLISFVDIHGDIVTNLKPNGFLSDSDGNSGNNSRALGGDGRVLLNSTIEKIELRSLTVNDIKDVTGDGIVDERDLAARLALSSYSIYGNIYAGAGFGADDGGLIIDSTGFALQSTVFEGFVGNNYFQGAVKPGIGSIKIGTAASNDYFSFGASRAIDTEGFLIPFVPQPGVAGGSIKNVHAATNKMPFTLDSLEAGGGGIGAKGGDIINVALNGDDAGGYRIIAGNGGLGPNGGNGGSIINLSDAGSVTSYILLKTGDGGTGLTGVGGNGGTLQLGTFNASAHASIQLGNGGSGFLAGGNGANLTTATIVNPEGHNATPSANVGLWRPLGEVGINSAIDFDLDPDGISDYVYTSADPGQLVVVLYSKDPQTGDRVANRIYLDGFANAEALTVGDFNGDGHPDIATASSDVKAGYGGVRVFLSQYGNDGHGHETFEGFSRAINSPIPSLSSFNNESSGIFYRSANAVTSITAGDFNGDGVVDIALTATYFETLSKTPYQVLWFMTNDSNGTSQGTGSFYADFGKPADTTQTPTIPADNFMPFAYLARGKTTARVEAAPAETFPAHDFVVTAVVGDKAMIRWDNCFGGLGGDIAGPDKLSLSLDKTADTDRSAKVALVGATLQDFTVVDYQGKSTFAVITQFPVGFLVAFQIQADQVVAVTGNADNAGIPLSSGPNFVAIRPTAMDGDGTLNDVAVLNYSPDDHYYKVNQVSFAAGSTQKVISSTFLFTEGRSNQIVAFDTIPAYYSNSLQATHLDYAVGVNLPSDSSIPSLNEFPVEGLYSTLMHYGFDIMAGNGGNSFVGKGGTGGSLGSGFLGTTPDPDFAGRVNPIGSLSLTFSSTSSMAGEHSFTAGTGGNGLTSGGMGGSINGAVTRDVGNIYDDVVSLHAGDGGYGVSGSGGSGGNLLNLSTERGIEFTAGNGGPGKFGGAGGSILGNGIVGAYDTETPELTLIAGAGGNGTKLGGNGGQVAGFTPRFQSIIASGTPEPLIVVAGAGGNGISGKGGNGGSITNIHTLDDENYLRGEIYMTAGDGGGGTIGGNGGSISGFSNHPTSSDNPTIVSFIAGNGGAGTIGKGGAGGSIASIETISTGHISGLTYSEFTYDRILAGNGGASSASVGGSGGNVSGLLVSASQGPIAVVAGTGGSGLKVGGTGGSVLNSNVTSSGPDTGGKVLVIAGAGGSASAFTSNPNDRINNSKAAFGGTIGRGGNGGSIIGFTQENSIDVSVDLIAGNGGDTVNYGNTNDTKAFVGKGGSILNINLAGSIGSVDPTHKIKAYNDLDGDGRSDLAMADWVNTYLRGFSGAGQDLGDGIGNVGIVAGAGGRIKALLDSTGRFDTQPAAGAAKLNGTVQNVTARLMMSAVAGDVNRIAAIHAAKNIKISGSIVGADKGQIGVLEYLDVDGSASTSPILGGKLLDGAFVSDNLLPEIDGNPRVFVL